MKTSLDLYLYLYAKKKKKLFSENYLLDIKVNEAMIYAFMVNWFYWNN